MASTASPPTATLDPEGVTVGGIRYPFPLVVGACDMSAAAFYHALAPDLGERDYALPPVWHSAVAKYPPICPALALETRADGLTYTLRDIPVFAAQEHLEATGDRADARRARWEGVRDATTVRTPDELARLTCYKMKPLLPDATFGPRVLLHPDNARTCADMADRLAIDREFKKFVYYAYACFIEAARNEHVADYEAFRRFYGDAVYAIEVERAGVDGTGGAAIGLMWPDWICHAPDAHLELGILYSGAGKRYEAFSGFAAGEPCTIRILAHGCRDLELATVLHKEPSYRWSNLWYTRALRKEAKGPETSAPSGTDSNPTQ